MKGHRKTGISSIPVSVSVSAEHYARLRRMMQDGENRSSIVDDALARHFRHLDRKDGGGGSLADALDAEDKFKLLKIVANSMRSGEESSPEQAAVDAIMIGIEALESELPE